VPLIYKRIFGTRIHEVYLTWENYYNDQKNRIRSSYSIMWIFQIVGSGAYLPPEKQLLLSGL